jgi:predicted naringenin-chalcone synthase
VLDELAFFETMKRRLARFGCGDDKIASRGHEVDDCSHLRWNEMEIYGSAEDPNGAGMRVRTRAFGRIAQRAFGQLFAEVEIPPQHLLHVTCTGYESPSAAQLLVARNEWGRQTSVTHVYHMGCYAALPALRIASGFRTQAGAAAGTQYGQSRVDIVHTEICSLHLNPLRHDPEQLVIQSLFADGCIAYSLGAQGDFSRPGSALALLAQDEWIVPDSAASMAWFCSDFGMEMTLARDVPDKIAQSLEPFVASLLGRADVPRSALESALFAIHPGGPKIVEQVGASLGLREPQIAHSRQVLRERGNMSSATLPHVWKNMAESNQVPDGQLVVSLAFGPGLTLSGAVLRKVVSSC